MAGKFIVLEGPDGSGKSSMIEEIKGHLRVKGRDALFVRDPGGTAIGGRIREILLDREHENMTPMTELLLYVASRAQLVGEVIRPALAKGRLVFADRFHISTLVYQGVEGVLQHGEIGEQELREIVEKGHRGVEPDHILFLDVPAEVGLERVGREQDRMEQKGLLFFTEVRQRYLGFADALPTEKATIIDAARPILEVTREVLEVIDELLP